jgi:hypothetical protein
LAAFFGRLAAEWRLRRIVPLGPHARLKVALVSDELTRFCLAHECEVRDVTPANARRLFSEWKPDLLFVESAWEGSRGSWKYAIAAYPGYPERTNERLKAMLAEACDRHIPALFWNKEDSAHFDRFAASASLFDTIFTVDENCLAAYRSVAPHAEAAVLMFAAAPAIHHPGERGYSQAKACFVGSYSRHIHAERRTWQDMAFAATRGLGLTVFDRNSTRRSGNYRYPDMPWIEVRPRVPHDRTGDVYRDHMVSLNVNTVTDSPSMFSRRLIESLACGAVVVSNPSLSIDRHFRDYCETAPGEDELQALFARLKSGPSPSDRERARAGAAYVLKHHTWSHRLEEILARLKRV